VRAVRSYRLVFAATGIFLGVLAPSSLAQDPSDDVEAISIPTTAPAADQPATVDGSQVIARINGQVVQACEVLWMVNFMIDKNRDKIPPNQLNQVRELLIKKQLASIVDRKLLYDAFRRNVPAENIPHVEEQIAPQFEEHEVPLLMKQFNVGSQPELERELCRMGSSLADAKRAFNERVIAGEWMRNKIKVNEDISPLEVYDYYQTNLTKYDFPAQARWEELMVRKGRFADAAQAYAELAWLGNEVWQRAAANPDLRQPIFTDAAKAKSDGATASAGGQYGWTNKGSLRTQAIDDALFKLEVGKMSPIIESETGFHIVRVLERKQAGRKPFTEVQFKIRDDLKDERLHAAQDKYLAELRSEASIETIYTGKISADALRGAAPLTR
jgi:PPIC-type PPIASE domain